MFQTRDEGKGVWRSDVQDPAGLIGGQFFAGLGSPDIFDKRSRAAVQPRVAERGFFIGLREAGRAVASAMPLQLLLLLLHKRASMGRSVHYFKAPRGKKETEAFWKKFSAHGGASAAFRLRCPKHH